MMPTYILLILLFVLHNIFVFCDENKKISIFIERLSFISNACHDRYFSHLSDFYGGPFDYFIQLPDQFYLYSFNLCNATLSGLNGWVAQFMEYLCARQVFQ